jgi:uncharacterized phage-associated protein
MGHTVKAIANEILDLAEASGKKLSPLKLQKLVYIAHGWHLAINDAPLVDDEFPEAWQFGPVYPSLYHEFKAYGRDPIGSRATELERNGTGPFDFRSIAPKVDPADTATKEFLGTVWEKYGGFSGYALSEATHKEGTPWSDVRKESGGTRNADIRDDIVKAHYRSLAQSRAGSSA